MFRKSINHAELKLGEKLGNGGYGVVYKATWRHSDVAVKQILLDKISPDSAQEFETESQIMGQLSSPNIIQFFGFCTNPVYCIVMEYMPNGSLFNLLHSEKPLEWSLRFSIALDIAKGLSFLHQEKILHRDIKSANVLLDKTYQAKLTDFGLSKVKSESQSTSTSKGLMGTLAWMAPELGLEGSFTQKSDVYSLGITFWELASRERPFKKVVNAALIPLKASQGYRDDIPKDDCLQSFGELIKDCWQTEPEKRPGTDNIITSLKSVIEQFEKISRGESKEETKITSPISGAYYESNLHSETTRESKTPPKPMLLSKRLEGFNPSPENPIPAQVIPLKESPQVNTQELSTFLKLVAEGEQDQAEAMLQKNQALALVPGDVTDLSGRSFKNITGFQYALWALDRHMWSMIKEYLDREAIRSQIEAMDSRAWVNVNGKSANWQPLLNALDKQVELLEAGKWGDAERQWQVEVGGAQRQLPVHVVNEYCYPNRSFNKHANFAAELTLPRTRQTEAGEWFTASHNGGCLGEKFAVCRNNMRIADATALPGRTPDKWYGYYALMEDRAACHALLETRMRERDAFFQKYQAKSTLKN